MWTINLSTETGWSIQGFGIDYLAKEITYYSTIIDPVDFFWTLVADTTRYRDRIEIFREIIKRKIPFRLQYNIEECVIYTMEEKCYNTFINYTIVVDDPKYALICKLTWS